MGTQSEQIARQVVSGAQLRARARGMVPQALAAAPGAVVALYGLLALLIASYVLSVAAREGLAGNHAVDGWSVAVVELLACAACLSRLFVSRPPLKGRGFVLALGLGMLSWSIGDTIAAVHFPAPPPVPSEICYLGFYPLAYVAVVLLMRQEVARFPAPTWLDGALAGLGAAAVCAAFAFKDVLHSNGGSAFTTAMNFVYPIGDVLLLALVVGGTAMLQGVKRTRWLLVATACTVNAIGDTFNLLHSSVGASAVGQAFNATAWPVAILLMSAAVWVQPASPIQQGKHPASGFVLPGLSAAAGLAILTVGSVHPIGRVALGLASATLAVAGVRLAISVGSLRTITEQRHRQSITDELTGLGNRRQLSHLFASLQASGDDIVGERASQRTVAVLFVDLDRFKEVNDSFGHGVGDELLKQIGPRLASSLRYGDTLVRLGGDEFAVVLPDTDEDQAFRVAQRIVSSLDQPFFLDLVPVHIGASVGVAIAPRDGSDLNTVLRCADAAMYRAKLSRVPVQVYDSGFDESGDPLHLAEELRDAVGNGELVLHFQPQLDLRTGTISAVEALLRWEHPRLGTIAPLKFLPLAEESGLMPAITARVLEDALVQCATWRADGHDLAVSVNVSASNLLDPGFFEMVTNAIDRTGVPPHALVLEITETCIISDYERSREVIDRLQRLGVVTSIDDFGAGFTSLAYLSNLAVGELKLDRAFIAPLAERDGQRDIELVRSTIGLGHALGLRVVAEGIETEETLSMLRDFGCDVAQGFLISRPVPAERLGLQQLDATWRSATSAVGEVPVTVGTATNGSIPV